MRLYYAKSFMHNITLIYKVRGKVSNSHSTYLLCMSTVVCINT